MGYEFGLVRTDSGRFLDKGNQVFNVCHPDFGNRGAKGDGETDDFLAIKDANTAAAVNGGIVFFPPGTYRFTQQITQRSDNVHWVGAGWSSILQSAVSSGTAVYINNNTSGGSSINGFVMRDLLIDGSGAEDVLVRVDYALDGVIDRVYITGSGGTGLQVGRGQNLTVRNCSIRSNGGWGIFQTVDGQNNGGQTFRVVDCTIKGNGLTVAGTGGIFLRDGAEHIVRGNQIERHDADANCRGIMCWTDNTIITENIFEENTVTIEVGSKNGLYGQTGDRPREQITIRDNKGNNSDPSVVRLVNVTGLVWRNNRLNDTTVSVDETNNKYLNLDSASSVTLGGSVVDGKVVSLGTAVGTSTSELQATFADQDATPSVRGRDAFRTANTVATSITNFDGGHTGKQFFVRAGDNNTTIVNDANKIRTLTNANVTLATGDLVVFEMLSGTGATDEPASRMVAFSSIAPTTPASSGTLTIKSGSGSNADSAGLYQVAPGIWVPYFTDPTP